MTHLKEIQAEIALLTKELERTISLRKVAAIRDKLALLSNELAGYQLFK